MWISLIKRPFFECRQLVPPFVHRVPTRIAFPVYGKKCTTFIFIWVLPLNCDNSIEGRQFLACLYPSHFYILSARRSYSSQLRVNVTPYLLPVPCSASFLRFSASRIHSGRVLVLSAVNLMISISVSSVICHEICLYIHPDR